MSFLRIALCSVCVLLGASVSAYDWQAGLEDLGIDLNNLEGKWSGVIYANTSDKYVQTWEKQWLTEE